MYDIILSGGLVYDGLGNPPEYLDIGITGKKIKKTGCLSRATCLRRINVKGLCVSPGFIDIHSHSDVHYFVHPQAECKIRQGVTTEVVGNCGVSAAPLYGPAAKRRKREWKELGVDAGWNSFSEYTVSLENKGVGVNVVPLAGHGNIRGAVLGYGNVRAGKKDVLKMCRMIDKAMAGGAHGMSTGLIYTPGMYADTKELIALLGVVSEYEGIYTTHIRGEGDRVKEAVAEAVFAAEESGVRLQISHLKTSGRRNWGRLTAMFRIIEDGIKRGLDITCDRYPYTASNTDLDTVLPDWFHRMICKDRRKILRIHRKRLSGAVRNSMENGWGKEIMISRIGADIAGSGMFIKDIAREAGLPLEETVLYLLDKTDFRVEVVFFCMSEYNLKRILKKPYIMAGSDSSLRTVGPPLRIGHPHPRTFGTFPRILSRYTGRGGMTLEEALYKMTGQPAEKLRLEGRGHICEGAYADITVFNMDNIKDKADYKDPFQYPSGIEFVIINGRISVEKGGPVGCLAGEVLLKK